jgi:hypothetical protein
MYRLQISFETYTVQTKKNYISNNTNIEPLYIERLFILLFIEPAEALYIILFKVVEVFDNRNHANSLGDGEKKKGQSSKSTLSLSDAVGQTKALQTWMISTIMTRSGFTRSTV